MLKEVPDGSGRLFVIDQLGYLYVIQPDNTVDLYLNFREELLQSTVTRFNRRWFRKLP
jgi:hypothetical protein